MIPLVFIGKEGRSVAKIGLTQNSPNGVNPPGYIACFRPTLLFEYMQDLRQSASSNTNTHWQVTYEVARLSSRPHIIPHLKK